MRMRPKYFGTYFAYAMHEDNGSKLPREDFYKVIKDTSKTFCGIALYRRRLFEKEIKTYSLTYLGVYCDEE